MALVQANLWAKQGTILLAGRPLAFWGFSADAGGAPTLPGPVLEATVGDTVEIVLQNPGFAQPVSLIFPGQEAVSVLEAGGGFRRVAPQYRDGAIVSLADYLEPEAESSLTYRFRAVKPGIYLYESGTEPEIQVQMGLYGILIVRPPGHDLPGHPNYQTAYGAGTGSEYDRERILVLGEIDSRLHEAVAQGAAYDILDFAPDRWLINGRSYPDTLAPAGDPGLPSQPRGAGLRVKTGWRVLLRIVNAGFQHHTLVLGGLTGRVVAGDGFSLVSPALDASYHKSALTLGSGQSYDVIVVPEAPGEYFLHAGEYHHLVNDDLFPGGMMTKMEVVP
ncbi:MAG: multicopper oxidase domain-containing protein [Firmicutes bacterium]|nr:multicopper oxidase domain-containing protein [Bacillota bacterium]